MHPRPDRFTLVAESRAQGCDAIIGEASYAFDSDTRCGEFAISVADSLAAPGLLGSALVGGNSARSALAENELSPAKP